MKFTAIQIYALLAVAVTSTEAAYSCTPGYFCVYSDWNGGGVRCQWSSSTKANTADDCSIIQQGQNVRSVWNKTGHRVQYYTQTNYLSRVGSSPLVLAAIYRATIKSAPSVPNKPDSSSSSSSSSVVLGVMISSIFDACTPQQRYVWRAFGHGCDCCLFHCWGQTS